MRSYTGILNKYGVGGAGYFSIQEWEETGGLFKYYTGKDFDPSTGNFTFGLSSWQLEYPNINPNLELTMRYCLSEPLELPCQILVNRVFFMAVTIACAVKLGLALVITILYDRSGSSLIILGDAIQSFLRIPDSTTIGKCLWGGMDFRSSSENNASPRAFHKAAKTLSSAITTSMWRFSYIFTVLLGGIWIALLILATRKVPMYATSVLPPYFAFP